MQFPALRQNLRRHHGFAPLELVGELPDALRGTLYRCGPGVFDRFGVHVEHAFEADGVISAVRMFGAAQRPQGAARVIESAGYLEEEQAQRRLYGSEVPLLRRIANGLRTRGKNTANTSAWVWNDRLYGLMEGARPTRIDPDTLTTLGEDDLSGVVGRTFSAHPHRVAALQTSFDFGVRYGREHALDLYAMPDAGSARHLGSVPMSWPALVHDFAATREHLLFVLCPAPLVIWRALLGAKGFERLFRWEPERGCEILLVPIAAPEQFRRIPTEAFWVWHFANAFERGGGEVVLDLCRYRDLSSLITIGHAKQRSDPAIYHRMIIDAKTGKARSEARLAGAVEFPRVDPRVEGGEHRLCWLRHSPDSGDAPADKPGVSLLEVETGKCTIWSPSAETHLSETVAVPMPGSDDERHVWGLTLCYDKARDRSYVAVLDGRDLERGPVAELWFDQPIPETFPGVFRPA